MPSSLVIRTRIGARLYGGPNRHNQRIAHATEALTVGHSTHPEQEFVALLEGAGIQAIADVRRYPGSRRNPQFGAEALHDTLAKAGIRYEQLGDELGGRRRPAPDSPNGAWRVDQFRGYADHMASDEFAAGVERLERLACEARTAVMCAEADWHRCHRRLLADVLLARGWAILHLGPDGSLTPHELTDFAVVRDERITYPAPSAAQQALDLG
jgi:uncharacterized protein (DUF488 family)